MKLNAKVAVALMALSSIGCTPNAYISNTLSKADSAVKPQSKSPIEISGSDTRIVADFNGDAILDMLISTTQGLVARVGKRNDTYRDTLIYKVDGKAGMAPGDITKWFDPETEKEFAFFSLPNEISYWTIDGKKKFLKNKIYDPMNDEKLELSDRVNNTVLEDGDNIWGITASKNSITSYVLNSGKISSKKKEKEEKTIVEKKSLFPVASPFAPDITTGYFNSDEHLDLIVLESSKFYFLMRNNHFKDSLVVNYAKGVDLKNLENFVTRDSISENSLKVLPLRTIESNIDDVLIGYGPYLLHLAYDSSKKDFVCESTYRMPLDNSSGKYSYTMAIQYNANGNAFIHVSPNKGNKIKYFFGPDGLKEN